MKNTYLFKYLLTLAGDFLLGGHNCSNWLLPLYSNTSFHSVLRSSLKLSAVHFLVNLSSVAQRHVTPGLVCPYMLKDQNFFVFQVDLTFLGPLKTSSMVFKGSNHVIYTHDDRAEARQNHLAKIHFLVEGNLNISLSV